MTTTSDRHLDLIELRRYLATGVPIEWPVEGQPCIQMFIDPQQPAIGMRCRDDGSHPETDLEHIEIRTVYRDGTRVLEVSIVTADVFIDGYPVLCAIADRVQLQSASLESAVSETLRLLGRLLQGADGLSLDAELGLFGELLFLRGLLDAVGTDEAVKAWLGPETEEHDFSLRRVDIEVKTTRGEHRRHWISSLSQLDSKPERPLWFVSYQLTRAGAHGGCTLPDLLDVVRVQIGTGANRALFEERLQNWGWRDSFADRLRMSWLRRTPAVAYYVGEDFPRLTSRTMDLSNETASRVVNVLYEIDLTGATPSSEVPLFLTAALGLET